MAFKKLTVKTGQVTGTHSNFPTLVQPSLITGLGSITLAEAQSARFYSDVGKTTELAREVVGLDEIHVKVTSMEALAEIWMDYDGIRADYAVTDTYGRNAVWTGYEAVHHLNGLTDSTANGHDLTNTNSVAFNSAKIGDGSDAGASNTNKHLGVNSNLGITNGAITASVWFKNNTEIATNGYYCLLDKASLTNRVQYRVAYMGNGGVRGVSFRREREGIAVNAANHNVTLGTVNWNKLDLTYDGTTVRGYLNGASVASVAASGNGSEGSENRYFLHAAFSYGSAVVRASTIQDEARITTAVRSANWITTEYNNQNANGSFWEATDAGGGGSTPAQAARRGAVMMM